MFCSTLSCCRFAKFYLSGSQFPCMHRKHKDSLHMHHSVTAIEDVIRPEWGSHHTFHHTAQSRERNTTNWKKKKVSLTELAKKHLRFLNWLIETRIGTLVMFHLNVRTPPYLCCLFLREHVIYFSLNKFYPYTVWVSTGQMDWKHFWWSNAVWVTLLMSCLNGELPRLQM